ncbi:MAG: hypothetical protein PF636_04790 [Actinomycetota bacterium]|nr:hypothetical protein [Actinomycetota bacterium]
MKPKQTKSTLHPKTSTGETPHYWECPECGFLSASPKFGSGESACPDCGATRADRREFPPKRLKRLDARIRKYHAEGESEIVVILIAAFLESILEDIIDRILTARGADLTVRQVVLDGQRAIGGRIGRLFPKLTGESFEGAAKELGYQEFPRRWRDMRSGRNAFIHDSPFNKPQEQLDAHTASEAMELLDQAYRLFVLINNKFVADGYSKHSDHNGIPKRNPDVDVSARQS